MTAKFPSSEERLEFLERYTNRNERSAAMNGMHFILDRCQRYLVRQYRIRDKAIALLEEGKAEEALDTIREIGKIE